MNRRFLRQTLFVLLLSSLLAACGGGGNSSNTSSSKASVAVATPGTNAPTATGNTATDGFNWFNYRRSMVGIAPLARNAQVDLAAQGHSNYLKLNSSQPIAHDQDATKPGFTGVHITDRLTAAGYSGPLAAYGEVISSTSDPSGFNAAEELIAAIYHRFVIFQPVFNQAGLGAAAVSGGSTYFTADFIALNMSSGLGAGKIVTYPVDGQQKVPSNFFNANESPNPVPSMNEVGYPISVHADLSSKLVVKTFTVQPRGGLVLQTRMLTADTDDETRAAAGTSAAAIIPLQVLASGTTYDVVFTGTVDDVPVTRTWSFTTQ